MVIARRGGHEMAQQYDLIVVGGGWAGAVVATEVSNRYARLHRSVDQPVFFNGIEMPRPVGKNLYNPKAS